MNNTVKKKLANVGDVSSWICEIEINVLQFSYKHSNVYSSKTSSAKTQLT